MTASLRPHGRPRPSRPGAWRPRDGGRPARAGEWPPARSPHLVVAPGRHRSPSRPPSRSGGRAPSRSPDRSQARRHPARPGAALHSSRRAPPVLPSRRREALPSRPFFFLPSQRALDAAWMDGDAEALLHEWDECRGGKRGVGRPPLRDEGHHVGPELVGRARPTLARQEAGEAVAGERIARLVKRGPRHPEGRHGRAHPRALALAAPPPPTPPQPHAPPPHAPSHPVHPPPRPTRPPPSPRPTPRAHQRKTPQRA